MVREASFYLPTETLPLPCLESYPTHRHPKRKGKASVHTEGQEGHELA